MNIAYVYYTNYDCRFAHGNQIIHTVNAIADHGHNVELITAGNPLEFAEANRIKCAVPVSQIPIRLPGTADRAAYYVYSLIRSAGKDAILTRDISFLRFLDRIPNIRRPPVIYEAHKVYSEINEMSPTEEMKRLSNAERVFTISQGVRDGLEDIDIDVESVIPDAATREYLPEETKSRLREELGVDDGVKVFVYAGSLSTWKNDIEMVIRSFTHLKEHIDSKLIIIGGAGAQSDVDPDDLRRTARDVGLDDEALSLPGYISHAEVFRYLKAADVGLVPLSSRNAVAERYTSPLKMYEYLVSGLQVVASDVPAIASEFKDEPSVHRYIPGNAEDFRRACIAATESGETADPERFTYNRRARRIATILSDVT